MNLSTAASRRLIDLGTLVRLCCRPLSGGPARAVLRAAVGLGGLARWWLREEVLQQAALLDPAYRASWTRQTVPSDPGSCWVMLVNRAAEQFPLLRPALVLPLCWVRGNGHAAELPPGLRDVANAVLRTLAARDGIKGVAWGLRLSAAAGLDDCDLSGLAELDAPSCWAPLAAGLVLAAEGLRPDPEVWATGAWNERYSGIDRVEGLSAKLELARTFGCREFFVPAVLTPEDARRLRELPGEDLRVDYLSAVENEPEKALAAYLGRLGAPPDLREEFEVRRRYWALQPTGSGRGRAYYTEKLLPTIIQMRREGVSKDWPDWRPRWFVTVVSDSPDLIRLCFEAVGAEYCLLLHSDEKRFCEAAERARRALGLKEEDRCRLAPFRETNDLQDAFRPYLDAFLAGVDPSDIVFDITPGKRNMTLALAAAAPVGSCLLYVDHDFRPDRRPEPGSERLLRWLVRAPLQATPLGTAPRDSR